ncbi:hypothetical protein [Halomonas salinarum]|uniref:hypothetical protein n=1 Tax=Halomonas salinarum TaxID=1158993 RepID=UPI001438A32D|nr:hypothetical protein [Halomonas salinarum]
MTSILQTPDVHQLIAGLPDVGHYFTCYNQERPRQGLDDATPDELYFPQPLNNAA